MNIKQLAERTGFSTATVSRVLQGDLNVDPATRDAVMEHLAQLPFYADTKPKKKKLRNLYAVLSPVEISSRIYDSHVNFFTKMFSGIRDVLNAAGSDAATEPCILNYTYRHGQLAEKLTAIEALPYSGHIAAFFLINGREADEQQLLSRPLNAPLFMLNRFYPESRNPDISFIYFDNVRVGEIALRVLREKGHRNIGVLTGPLDYRYYRERAAAFTDPQSDVDTVLFTASENTVQAAAEAARAMIPRIQSGELTAVFTCSELLLEGCLLAFGQAGLTAGKDISLVSSNDYFLAYQHTPQITVVRTPSYELGELAAALALKGVEMDFKIRTDCCLDVKLAERQSVLFL